MDYSSIIIYTIPDCKYCKMAKDLLKSYQYKYEEVVMDRSEYVIKINEVLTKEQRNNEVLTKAPQIVINNTLIGGYTNLLNKLKYDSIDFYESF
jgi:glutaredoxin